LYRKDSFYKFRSPEELELAHANLLDFDHPDAIDMPMFAAVSATADYLFSYLVYLSDAVLGRAKGLQAVKYTSLLIC
jgi:hypothetical protein